MRVKYPRHEYIESFGLVAIGVVEISGFEEPSMTAPHPAAAEVENPEAFSARCYSAAEETGVCICCSFVNSYP